MLEINERLNIAYKQANEFVKEEELIGIQKEKILHKTLKYYISLDDKNHEIKIKKSDKGILYADVLIDDNIYEIQTRSFDKLRSKLDEFLKDYNVTVVFPIAKRKSIYKILETGEIEGPKKSPKIGKVFDAFKELYKIKKYLLNSNFKLKIILLDIDEYRNIVTKKHSRSSGYIREVQIPKCIYQEIDFKNKKDYLEFLEQFDLPIEFTSTNFAKIVKIRKTQATIVLNILTHLNVVERIGREKNSYVYKKNLKD